MAKTYASEQDYIKNKIKIVNSGCWLWQGVCGRHGYGRYKYRGVAKQAHRAVYIFAVGSIPIGLTLDHLCRVTNCVNPAHLQPCTIQENIFAPHSQAVPKLNKTKTHCINGHEFTSENVLWQRNYTKRGCRICNRESIEKGKLNKANLIFFACVICGKQAERRRWIKQEACSKQCGTVLGGRRRNGLL